MSLRPLAFLAAVSLLAFAVPMHPAEDVPRARELLKHFVGTWDVDAEYMGMPPSKGVEVNHLLAHGLTIVTEYRAPMGPGAEFEGHGLLNFNPRTGKWTQVWADSMDPNLGVSEGHWSEDGKVFTVEIEGDMGLGPTTLVLTTTIVDADTNAFTMVNKKTPDAPPVAKMRYVRRAEK